MGKAANLRKKILNAMAKQGDLIPLGELRTITRTAYKSTNVMTITAYSGYTCRLLLDNGKGLGLISAMAENTDLKPTDEAFWLTFAGTLNSYSTPWNLNTSATTTTRPKPARPDQLVVSSKTYHVLTAAEMTLNTDALFLVLCRRVGA